MENPIGSFLVRGLWKQNLCRRLGLEQDYETLLRGHQRWCRCIGLCSHLRTPCALCIWLHCWSILLRSHRLGGRWIRLRGHRLRSRCIKLPFDWCGKEIWMHTISSWKIPSFGKSRCRSTLHSCRNRRSGSVDRSYCSCRCCSSSLWWYLTVTRSCLAILSRPSFSESLDHCVMYRVAHNSCTLDESLRHSLANRIYHLVFTLNLCQGLEGWKNKLLDHLARSGNTVRLEAFTLKLFHQFLIFLLLFFFELVFENRNLVFFIDFRFICDVHHIEAFGPTRRAKRCVDAKINTLESEGNCSPNHGKSTKHASQFDLKLTREKTKSNLRAYQLGFRISLIQAHRQALPIQ